MVSTAGAGVGHLPVDRVEPSGPRRRGGRPGGPARRRRVRRRRRDRLPERHGRHAGGQRRDGRVGQDRVRRPRLDRRDAQPQGRGHGQVAAGAGRRNALRPRPGASGESAPAAGRDDRTPRRRSPGDSNGSPGTRTPTAVGVWTPSTEPPNATAGATVAAKRTATRPPRRWRCCRCSARARPIVEGQYTTAVFNGLRWLTYQQGRDGDLRGEGGGRMYAHGMAAIVLCEAYGLTGDSRLREPRRSRWISSFRPNIPRADGVTSRVRRRTRASSDGS